MEVAGHAEPAKKGTVGPETTHVYNSPAPPVVLGDFVIWKGSGEEVEDSFHIIPQYPASVRMQLV